MARLFGSAFGLRHCAGIIQQQRVQHPYEPRVLRSTSPRSAGDYQGVSLAWPASVLLIDCAVRGSGHPLPGPCFAERFSLDAGRTRQEVGAADHAEPRRDRAQPDFGFGQAPAAVDRPGAVGRAAAFAVSSAQTPGQGLAEGVVGNVWWAGDPSTALIAVQLTPGRTTIGCRKHRIAIARGVERQATRTQHRPPAGRHLPAPARTSNRGWGCVACRRSIDGRAFEIKFGPSAQTRTIMGSASKPKEKYGVIVVALPLGPARPFFFYFFFFFFFAAPERPPRHVSSNRVAQKSSAHGRITDRPHGHPQEWASPLPPDGKRRAAQSPAADRGGLSRGK